MSRIQIPMEPVTRRILSLVAVLIGALVIVLGQMHLNSNYLRSVEAEIVSGRNKQLLGQILQRHLLVMKHDVHELSLEKDPGAIDTTLAQLRGGSSAMEEAVVVLSTGGIVVDVLPMNLDCADELQNVVEYHRDPNEGVSLELVGLMPKITELRSQCSTLASLHQQHLAATRAEEERLGLAVELQLETTDSLLRRIGEDVNQIYYDATTAFLEIREQGKHAAMRVRTVTYATIISLVLIGIVVGIRTLMQVSMILGERAKTHEDLKTYGEHLDELIHERTTRLAESEEAAMALLNAPSDAIVLLDTNGVLLEANDAFGSRIGRDVDDVAGECLWDLLPTEEASRKKLAAAAVALSGEPEHLQKHREGDRWDDVVIYPVFDAQARVTRLAIVTRDITEQKEAEAQIRAARADLEQIVTVTSPLCVINTDYTIRKVNQGFCDLFHTSVEEALGSACSSVIKADQCGTDQCPVDRIWKGLDPVGFESSIPGPDGESRSCVVAATAYRSPNGEVSGAVESYTDITDRKSAEEELKASEERFSIAFRASPESISITSLDEGRFLEINETFTSITGFERDEAIGQRSADLNIWVDMQQREQFISDLQEHGAIRNEEYSFRRKNGESFVGLLSAEVIELGGSSCVLAVLIDITERKRAEEKLRYDALHDGLTGLANRALLVDRAEACIERHRRNPDYRFGLLFIDLDRFKVINDSLGHEIGDQLLITMAGRLKQCLRATDCVARVDQHTIARIGGDEFVVMLDDLREPDDAARVAQRLLDMLHRPLEFDEHEIFISASIGISLSDVNYESANDMLRDADTAMYRAKEAGKACYEVFDKEMHRAAIARLHLENDLRRAIEEDQLSLQYQPIIALHSGELAGFEALVRWHHPELGVIPPASFIPIAEETGLIVPIGRWVLDEGCRQLRYWRETFSQAMDLSLSINASKRQLTAPNFVDDLDQIIQSNGLIRERLIIEITESVVIESPETVAPILQELHRRGIPLHMDDFGTGESSLSCLHHFPIKALKVDRQFILNMQENEEHAVIVNAIIALAHNMGLNVIAEGVETHDQLNNVLVMNCDYGQGYLFARPMDPSDVEQFITSKTEWIKAVV